LALKQHLQKASDGTGHWPGVGDLVKGSFLGAVSEWSLRLPDWDPSFGMYAGTNHGHSVIEPVSRDLATILKC